MLFVLVCAIGIAVSVAVFKKAGVVNPYSKGVAMALGLSILAAVCLAQNYTVSLIPEANDGIGISNPVAYWIIGEDGWSQEKFRQSFERSVYFTLLLMLVYPLVVTVETKIRTTASRT
jgi:hypothetical protein